MEIEAPRVGNTNCCVPHCINSYKNTQKYIHFYKFPFREHEKEVRKKWIQAIKRMNSDESEWQPTKSSRICSAHFIGGVKSNHPHHPAYVPSLFSHTTKQVNDEQVLQRFERVDKRRLNATTPIVPKNEKSEGEILNEITKEDSSVLKSNPTNFTHDQYTQISTKYNLSSFEFTCSFESGNNAQTFANIGNLFHKPETSNKFCGPEIAELDGF